jgi:hypothetical protein
MLGTQADIDAEVCEVCGKLILLPSRRTILDDGRVQLQTSMGPIQEHMANAHDQVWSPPREQRGVRT